MRSRRSLDRMHVGANGTSAGLPQRVAIALAMGLAVGMIGCSGLDPVPRYEQITDPAQLFMALTIDHPAVNLSTAAGYNTLQLTATPRNALGEPMSGLSAPVFHLDRDADSTTVTVTPTGLVTARAQTGDPVLVVAELRTGDNVRRVDTTFVTVTTNPTPPVLTTFSIDPVPPDSAIWAIRERRAERQVPIFWVFFSGIIRNIKVLQAGGALVLPQALDATDTPIVGLTVEYTSLDPTIATVDRRTGEAKPLRPGPVRIVARTTAYGVTKVDTATFMVTWSFDQAISYNSNGELVPSEVKIAPYGLVFWFNDGGAGDVDVTFDDPANVAKPFAGLCDFLTGRFGPGPCGAGNFLLPVIPDLFDLSEVRVRQFPVPGDYPYHTSTGATGRIIVE